MRSIFDITEELRKLPYQSLHQIPFFNITFSRAFFSDPSRLANFLSCLWMAEISPDRLCFIAQLHTSRAVVVRNAFQNHSNRQACYRLRMNCKLFEQPNYRLLLHEFIHCWALTAFPLHMTSTIDQLIAQCFNGSRHFMTLS